MVLLGFRGTAALTAMRGAAVVPRVPARPLPPPLVPWQARYLVLQAAAALSQQERDAPDPPALGARSAAVGCAAPRPAQHVWSGEGALHPAPCFAQRQTRRFHLNGSTSPGPCHCRPRTVGPGPASQTAAGGSGGRGCARLRQRPPHVETPQQCKPPTPPLHMLPGRGCLLPPASRSSTCPAPS